jgi:hypothetical protein
MLRGPQRALIQEELIVVGVVAGAVNLGEVNVGAMNVGAALQGQSQLWRLRGEQVFASGHRSM